jgi:hypothetical protein
MNKVPEPPSIAAHIGLHNHHANPVSGWELSCGSLSVSHFSF